MSNSTATTEETHVEQTNVTTTSTNSIANSSTPVATTTFANRSSTVTTTNVTSISSQIETQRLIVESIQIDDYPSSGRDNAVVDPNKWYQVFVKVSDTNTIAHVNRVELRMYKTNLGWTGASDGQRELGAAWTSDGVWQYLYPGSGWSTTANQYLDSQGSFAPGDRSATVGLWVFKFKWPVLSHYTTNGGWRIEVQVEDDELGFASLSRSFDVNLYITFSMEQPSSLTSGEFSRSVLTYTANAIVKVQVAASDPKDAFGHSFSSDHVMVNDVESQTGGHRRMLLNNNLRDWYLDLPVAENGVLVIWWFATVPNGVPIENYSFTYTLNVTFQAFA
jgi:hypothetical protein